MVIKPEEITFENMVHKLPEVIPEFRSGYKKEIEWWGDEEPGQHVVYANVMYDSIEKLLHSKEEPNKDLLKRIFDFLEVLANHPEEYVQEVAHNSVCEAICSDEIVLQKAQKYMGKRTRGFCKMILGDK